MNISTNPVVRETKSDVMARASVITANNGTNNTTNNNVAVVQSKVVKTDTVELSKKSVELATTTQSEPKVEKATEKVTAREKSTNAKTNYRQAMKQSQHELSHLAKGLKKAGMSSREVGKIIKTANREANKTIGKEIKKAYNDYRGKKISRNQFTNKLYGAAVKKLDSIVSAMKNVYIQKMVTAEKSAEKAKEAANETKSTDATKATEETRVTHADEAPKAAADENTKNAKEAANETKSTDATKATEKTRATDTDEANKIAAKEHTEKVKETSNETVAKADDDEDDDDKKAETTTTTTTSELIVKEEKVVAEAGADEKLVASKIVDDENADNTFSQIVDFFNGIDKLVNGFADGVEGNGSDEEDGQSLVSFASRLSDMFSNINKAFGRNSDDNVGYKLGMAQIRKETISQLFDNGHGSGGAIHRIGDAGEGSGNFNAVSFMSSISNGINDALDNYNDVKKDKEEAEAKAEAQEVGGALA